ncbi:MAG: hypothetical protein K9N49_07110 [Candidatus Marinimicrobia bacterium]|nr:hypothetical protein [Candidatus Neomarinimicrobiota bacterium]
MSKHTGSQQGRTIGFWLGTIVVTGLALPFASGVAQEASATPFEQFHQDFVRNQERYQKLAAEMEQAVATARERLDVLQAEQMTLEAQVAQLTSQVAERGAQVSARATELEAAQQQLVERENRLQAIRELLPALDRETAAADLLVKKNEIQVALRSQIETLQQERAGLQDELTSARQALRGGEIAVANLTTRLGEIEARQAKLTEEHQASLSARQTAEAALANETARREALEKELLATRTDLSERAAALQAALTEALSRAQAFEQTAQTQTAAAQTAQTLNERLTRERDQAASEAQAAREMLEQFLKQQRDMLGQLEKIGK